MDTNYCNAGNSDITYGNTSPNGNLVDVSDSVINIYPRSSTVPSISIPNTVGARGFSTRNFNDHVYNVWTDVRGLNLSPTAVGNALANNPTPGNDNPASLNGTRNNVGPITALFLVNYVRSFIVPTPDASRYTDIVVNYTIANNHVLDEGYVIRYGVVENGQVVAIRSYGEGHGWEQDPALRVLWCSETENVWDGNHQEIVTSLQ